MKTKKHLFDSTIYWSIFALIGLLGTCIYMTYAKDYLLSIVVGVLGICIILFNNNSSHCNIFCRISKTMIVGSIIFVALYILFALTQWNEFLQDGDKLKDLINDSLAIGITIYFFLCLLQVVILPIPSVLLTLVGANVFGATITFILTTIATILGSTIAFLMGRKWGKKLVVWLVGKKAYDKYNSIIKHNGKYYLSLMFLLPIFPDDILCMVAGISTISFYEFLWICILTRPIMIAFTCYFGTGEIIPFHGWGIPIWIGIFVVFTLIFIFGKRLGKKFEKNKSTKKSVESSNIQLDNIEKNLSTTEEALPTITK